MSKKLSIGLLFIATVLISFTCSDVLAAPAMTTYCQAPPYISSVVEPNLMLAVDVSGSMGYSAYGANVSDRRWFCSGNHNYECRHDSDHGNDCVRNEGVCEAHTHDDHTRYRCSGDHDIDCTSDSDCTHSWGACDFQQTTTSYGHCSNDATQSCALSSDCGAGNTCTPNDTYEGYFTPEKNYLAGICSHDSSLGCFANSDCGGSNTCNFLDADKTIFEYDASGTSCTKTCVTPVCNSTRTASCAATKGTNGCSSSKYYCGCSKYAYSGDCGSPTSGSLLNFQEMKRIDLLRWAFTGGSPATCTSSGYDKCDPRVYNDPGMTASGKIGTVCKDNLRLKADGTTGHGCILLTQSGKRVAVPWTGRIEEGLAFQFDTLQVKPRMGVYFYSERSIRGTSDSNFGSYIYLGDFTAAGGKSSLNYQNLITEVNATDPNGYTPTAPALWDILNYFKQVSPQYGGIDATSNSNWKSPMYACDGSGAGANCKDIACAKNFVLLMSDGLWNKGGSPSSGLAPSASTCSIDTGFTNSSADPAVPAYLMHQGFHNNVRNKDSKVTAVYALGMFVSETGSRALKNTAMYGSFNNASQTWPTNTSGYPLTTCSITESGAACPSGSPNAKGSNCTPIPATSANWDKDGDGVPDTYYSADDALSMKNQIMAAVLDMLSRVASGTAASVLASGEGSGANLIQSVFYPQRAFYGGNEIAWTSTMQNLWYYIDPRVGNSTIRENTADRSGATAMELNLDLDKIVNLYFDTTDQKTKADLFVDADGNGIKDSATPSSTVEPTDLKYLWEAGLKLWNKSAADRNIYTPLDTGVALTNSANQFKADTAGTNNLTTIRPKLNTDAIGNTLAQNNAVAKNLIDYIRGTDLATCSAGTCGASIMYRSRTGAIDLNKDGDVLDTVNGITEEAKVWKLGDMINATPKIASWVPLNNYNVSYNDSTYSSFTDSSTYTNRGMAFAGANDGMLHAFKLGALAYAGTGYCSVTSTVCTENAGCPIGETCNRYEMTTLSGSDLGNEEWAFIPSRALPYLQYLADPDYCHLYYVDTTPILFDASFNKPSGCGAATDYWNCTKDASSWRTVLIGGMRLGGACKAAATTYGVQGPTSTAGEGYSSYFALDITDPAVPKLLWEFAPTDGSLGFATSGPAVVKINARVAGATTSAPDKTKNGRWFVVFASGPTGPLQQNQFKGYSDQNLNLFVLDLATGALLRTIDTAIPNAFGGALSKAPIDYDYDYQDDALYLGYTSKCPSATPACATTTWPEGGVIRLVTREDLNSNTIPAGTALNPTNWTWNNVMTDIGAVTASVGHLGHYANNSKTPDKAYLYFGTGRYFFNNATAGTDDATTQRRIYGIVEPCLSNILSNTACASTVSVGDLTEAATSAGTTDAQGWYINLDVASGTTGAERIISNPVAMPNGAVFFTSVAPTNDVCSFGGNSYLWAVKYDTGGTAAAYLSGIGLLQTSTAAIEEVDLHTDFTEREGRRTESLPGLVPPEPPAFTIARSPINKILHIRKK